jgi:uncharacterized Zn finger protein
MPFYGNWTPYIPVAERKRRAQREVEKLSKKGHAVAPVSIEGRAIVTTFWGQAWCENLEHYSDFENRLPRGRAYVRNGSVVDLQISPGEIQARVAGSSLYTVKLKVKPVAKPRWQAICDGCVGAIDSLVELLQGRFSKSVMERICCPRQGLFPAPNEIQLSCSCPDWAEMCKHVAATLYGVGARLDHQPELLFRLRGVDEMELISTAGKSAGLTKQTPAAAKILQGEDLAAMFGVEMQDSEPAKAKPAKKRAAKAQVAKEPAPRAKAATKKVAAVPQSKKKAITKTAKRAADKPKRKRPA